MSGFDLLVAIAVGYLLGGFPTAAVVARVRGKRIFEVGSGNMGAMNTARNLGFGLGVAVLVVDVAKGSAAVLLGFAMASALGAPAGASLALGSSAGVAAIVGHAWSPYVGFRGGKALATGFGVTLPLFPWGGLAGLTLLVALVLILRRVTLATILTLLAFPLLAYLATMRATLDQDVAFTATTVALVSAVVIILKHLLLWRAARRTPADTDVDADADAG